MWQAKTNYYRDKITLQKDNPKDAWKTINNLLGRTCNNTVVNELKLNDRKINSPEELAEAFNNCFINIGPSLAHEMAHSSVSFESFVKPSHSELPEFRTVTNANVQKTLEGLSLAKATGSDNISGKILKVTGNALNLMKSYLTGHKQICQLNGVSSTENQIGCGIPQGSILGPLFFLLYINDLPECLRQTTPRLFADDTNLTATGRTVEEVERAMNGDLDYVKNLVVSKQIEP